MSTATALPNSVQPATNFITWCSGPASQLFPNGPEPGCDYPISNRSGRTASPGSRNSSEPVDTTGFSSWIRYIRYMTDTTNMQIWVMHNAARYAFMTADGFISLWDYENCEFLSGHNKNIDEVRRAISSTYFLAGPRFHEVAQRWADDLAGFISDHCGPNPRIAVDQVNFLEGKMLEEHGITIERGQEVMERGRLIKSADELDAMRCAAHACTSTMDDIREQVEPGMTETHVWSMLHAGNIRRGGEWIETQILASGPRTNPWFQEASSRVIENGDILAYDTDLVGAYGMCIDISRIIIF